MADQEVQLVHVEPMHEVEIETVSYEQLKREFEAGNLDDFDGEFVLCCLLRFNFHWCIIPPR